MPRAQPSFLTLCGAIHGLFASERGDPAGISDRDLLERVRDYLVALAPAENRRLLSCVARELYLVDAALESGCDLAQVASLYRWLRVHGMYLDDRGSGS